ncbi:MAG TPA: hypothetical protein VFI31_00140 [Pirellulales bacterium]|nr:hypothetical protein [Pirellulales bacterium]
MKMVVTVVFVVGLLCSVLRNEAVARPRYLDAFKERYAPDPGSDYGRLVNDSKCFICHPETSTKKSRNAYGVALSKVIGKNEKVKANVEKALGKIEKEKSPAGKTFGELIQEGKLPGG